MSTSHSYFPTFNAFLHLAKVWRSYAEDRATVERADAVAGLLATV